VHFAEPATAAVPAGQVLQVAVSVAPETGEKRPLAHGVHVEASPAPVAADHLPAAHATQALPPVVWYVPAAQPVQAVEPEVVLYWPRGQAMHADDAGADATVE
jgi:hypothetical protein